ncbi:MAG TPA: precorrin-3B C(17)-methyltransferase [Pirellulales bacterium]|nr:precorrin-3B C(17)-methyltransferase [Pirellulales bacterium]
MAGKLMLVGFGPGQHDHLTFRGRAAIEEAEVVIGYTTYIKLVKPLCAGKQVIYTGMTEELSRARKAIDLAYEGRRVALISSGDVGVYGMAGPSFEILKERGWRRGEGIEVEVIPGVTAAIACASVLGAPLMHDFCTISLSDLLTPWNLIVERIDAAAKADFVISLYNPKSGRRTRQIVEAQQILLRHRSPKTPVGLVKSCYRDLQKVVLTTLDDMLNHEIGMLTTVIVGNSRTFTFEGLMVTPRGYQTKYELESVDHSTVELMRRQLAAKPQPGRSLKTYGTLYGVGVGPGYAKYLTQQARQAIEKAACIFYPRGNSTDESLALNTIESFMRKDARVEELMFPMTKDRDVLEYHWNLNAQKVADVLATGQDAAFITLGDSTMFSTFIYLVRTLRETLPDVPIETVPGVSSFSAAAAMLNEAIGVGSERVAIVPVNRDVSNVRDALGSFETVVMLKAGSKLNRLVVLLEEMELIDYATMFSYIGTEDERIETDLRRFRNETAAYMTLIIVKKPKEAAAIEEPEPTGDDAISASAL